MEAHHEHIEPGEIVDNYLWKPVITAFLPLPTSNATISVSQTCVAEWVSDS